MKPLTLITSYHPTPLFEKRLLSLAKSDLIEQVFIISQESVQFKQEKCHLLIGEPLTSSETLSRVLGEIQTKYFLLITEPEQVSIEPKNLEIMLKKAESARVGMVYSDFYDKGEKAKTFHPLIDYQPGSVRDDFDFGAMLLFSTGAVRKALKKYGLIAGMKSAGLYALRLKLSIDYPILHLPKPLYSVIGNAGAIHESPLQEKIFSYVDPKNLAAQKEMEIVFTDYLKKIDAYLPPLPFKDVETSGKSFPVKASIVTPVRNRKETIAEAVKSGLSQETDFSFNMIVVDNHSADGTTAILTNLSGQHLALKHIIPRRTDLGIGGCWNEALQSEACGRYVVQLDSDDLYSSRQTLQKIIDMFHQDHYAMVIGSYTLVNSKLEEIPPGLIDHREWTDENGHNNALRINGLGAPRAFDTALMRHTGFLNVSYGEDYAAALRICREYRIGRIYESLYLCRRWPGNTDSAISLEQANQNNIFKDKTRTDEIRARQKIAKRPPTLKKLRRGK